MVRRVLSTDGESMEEDDQAQTQGAYIFPVRIYSVCWCVCVLVGVLLYWKAVRMSFSVYCLGQGASVSAVSSSVLKSYLPSIIWGLTRSVNGSD